MNCPSTAPRRVPQRLLVALLAVQFATAVVFADSPKVLTWQDCVTLAARHNPDLLSALRTIDASRAQYRGSYNGIFPHLSLSNSYTDSTSAVFNGFGRNESKIWQAQGNASLDLIDFGQWANIQAAAASLKQSEASAEVSATTVLLNLYKAFAALLFAQNEMVVDNSIRDTWKMNAEMVTLRYKSGSESKGNNMNTQAQFLQADANVNQAGRDVEVADQQLGQVLGMDEFNVLMVTGTWAVAPVPIPHPNFPALLPGIPQIKVQEAIVEKARIAIKAAHATLWPTLSLGYSKGTQGPTEFPQSPFSSFTGVVNYPLFVGGPTATYYASQAAQRT